jgi:acetyl-CoA carboxylase beta subunit
VFAGNSISDLILGGLVYRIDSKIQTSSTAFKENDAFQREAASRLRERLDEVKKGGPAAAVEKHRARGKLTARERIARLLDPNTPFLEFSALAANGMYEDQAPSAGVITGAGVVHGREVVVVANDATVKGGTYFPMTVLKHVRAQQIAIENKLPCVYLVDSGGVFLPLQDGVFPDKDHFGRIFYNQAVMSAQAIPQVCAVMGSCTAGGAYVPAMSDENVIVKNQGTIFIGGPPLVKAATGVDVTPEELGGADVHTRISGVSDHLAENDEHALQILRNVIEGLGRGERALLETHESEEPHYDPQELYGILSRDLSKPFDVREVIARIVDGSRFHEFKPLYGTDTRNRLCAHHGLSGRDRCQQWNSVCRELAQGRALHRNVRGAQSPAPVSAEHHRLHRRQGIRTRRHRARRRQDGARGCGGAGAQVHGHHRRIVRRRQLRHVRPWVLAAPVMDVAQRQDLRDGRPAGGRCAVDGEAVGGEEDHGCRRIRIQEADPRQVRA